MRALGVIVANEPPQPAANAGRTAVPHGIEAVRPLFERLEPPLNVVTLAILHLTAQSQSGQSGPVAEAIDQELCLREVVTLRETRQERRRGIGPAVAEHLDIEHQQRIEIDCSVTPPPLRTDLDRRLVDSDPPRSTPRRVILIVCEAVDPVPDRSM